MKTLQFDGSDVRLVPLASARRQISQYFGDQSLSKEPIHILVELPALGKCGTCICYCRKMPSNVVLSTTFPTYLPRTLTMPSSTRFVSACPRPPDFAVFSNVTSTTRLIATHLIISLVLIIFLSLLRLSTESPPRKRLHITSPAPDPPGKYHLNHHFPQTYLNFSECSGAT